MKRIVVLGGGSAGVMFSNRMRREFSRDELELIVIEKSEKHFYQPAFTLVVFNLEDPKKLIRPTRSLFFDGIKVIIDEATQIKPNENKVVTAKNGEYSYDYLVIATGGRLVFDEPSGLKEGIGVAKNVFTFYNYDGAIKLRDAFADFDGGTVVSSVCEMPIKCPAAPMKFILMAEDTARKKGIRDKCRFVFTTPMPAVFSREPYASKLTSLFSERGIETVPNFTPSEVDHVNGTISDYGGKKVNFDLISVTPPHEGSSLLEASEGIGDAANWVRCDKHKMISLGFPNIYSLGDATDFPTSKTASGIRKQAKVLVDIFKAVLKSEKPTATYDGEIICPILTRYKRVMFAHFNYEEAISPAIESYANWVLKVHMLMPMYWNLMLNGLL
ncbi:MAG: NAD(P)/FAD-dependent oxidoreductase [Candidatus Magnetoovum sp. WYHC-5]|nr:NAD(P)/FAD-dependent oxidoreductase [Candidatus Magnetoovum sp. WYHC-5]